MTRLLALVWPELRASETIPQPFDLMLDALDDLSPRVEAVDLGVALVDIAGLGPMCGPERRIAARAVMLTRAVAPLRVRCGIGDNRWLATLAARLARFERPDAPAAFHVVERDALPDLPLTLLPADAAMRQRFALFGLTAMGQLAGLPRSAVGAQFGPMGERLQALARGHDPRPIVARRRPERAEVEATFETPLDGVGATGLTLRRLAAELCDRLRARHLAPGRATLTLRFEDGPALRVAQAFPQPALEPDWIERLLLSRVEAAARVRGLTRESSSNSTTSASSPLSKAGRRDVGSSNVGESGSPEGSDQQRQNDVPANGIRSAIWDDPSDLETSEPRVTELILAFDRLADPASSQLPAFEARAGRWEELRWSLERIRHRFGEGRLWRATTERPRAALPEHRSRLVDIGP